MQIHSTLWSEKTAFLHLIYCNSIRVNLNITLLINFRIYLAKNLHIQIYTVSGKEGATYLQNSFTITLSSKFAIKKSLNIPPSFTHVATLPCKTVVHKNRKLHCRPILKTFNDNEQLHSKIICSVNSHILV